MGIFDFLGSAASQLGSDISGGLNLLSAGFSHPVDTIKNVVTGNSQGVVSVVNKTKSEGSVKTITNTVVNTAIASAALASAAALVGGSGAVAGAGAVVNKVVTAHPIASTATLLAAPVVANVLTSSPKTASVVGNAILTTPTALQNYGSNIGKAIENPSIANIMDIAKENPILTAATAAGAAYLGSGLVSTAVTALNTRAANANTKSVIENTNSSSVIDNATSSLPISSNMKMIMPVQSPDENIVMPSITKASNPAPSTKNKKKKVTTKKKKTKKKALKKKNTSKKKVTSKKKKKR